MGLSCKSRSSVAVCNSTQVPNRNLDRNNGGTLENFSLKELESATECFARENLIAKASHGQIFKGTLRDGRVVAVKRPATGVRHSEDEDVIENEMQILSKLFSRRLVNLLGCSQDGRVKLLVLEYMENGTLLENLEEGANQSASLSWPMRLKLALDIAKAIRALHASTPPIIHRNIKSTNVFIDRDGNARLGDFGLAKCMQDVEPARRSNLSSIPEIVAEEDSSKLSVGLEDINVEHEGFRISSKTDVFSFGIVLLEIMSGRSAVSLNGDLTHFRLVDWALPLVKNNHANAICDSRIKPPPDTVAVKQLAVLAVRCVRSSSSRRPSMDEVVQSLIKISKLVPEPVWTGHTGLNSRLKVAETSSAETLISETCTSCKPYRFVRYPRWTGFFSLKKRRALVYSLTKFLPRKFRIGARRYSKLAPRGELITNEAKKRFSKGLQKGAKVSDEGPRERLAKLAVTPEVLHKKLEKRRDKVPAGFSKPGSSSHRSGKQFVRLQMVPKDMNNTY